MFQKGDLDKMKSRYKKTRKNAIVRRVVNAVDRALFDPFVHNLYEAQRTGDLFLLNSLYEGQQQ